MVKNGLTYLLFLCIILVASLSACKKQEGMPANTKALIKVGITVDTKQADWDQLIYHNDAGNQYAISTLNCYISEFIFFNKTGTSFLHKGIYYLDLKSADKSTIFIDSIPPGEYIKMSFVLGLEKSNNVTGILPNTIDNLNMAWPDFMGGGYHFLKLEGYYLDSAGIEKGYAIHLGKNENLPMININCSMNQKYWDHEYSLNFNINEVFRNPYLYNLNTDQNYTMSDSSAMLKIKQNIEDVFILNQTR